MSANTISFCAGMKASCPIDSIAIEQRYRWYPERNGSIDQRFRL
jgi:hypothetical protein